MRYEVTVTLKPHLYRFTASEQFDMVRPIVEEIFSLYAGSAIAELTKENNIHIHGLVDLPGPIERNKFLNRWRRHHKIFGRKSCAQVVYQDSYDRYMRKDMDVTWQVLGRSPIVVDVMGVFASPSLISQ